MKLPDIVVNNRRVIGTFVFVVMMMLPVIFVFKTSPVVKFKGTIRYIDENGNIGIVGEIQGLDFKNENREGWDIVIYFKYVERDGYLDRPEYPDMLVEW